MEKAVQKLQIKNLSKSTKTTLVMDDITLNVHAGEIFALVGRPESCKTLLSKTIINLVYQTEGTINIDGAPNRKKLGKNARKIGAVVKQQNFYENMTAYNTMVQYASVNGHSIYRSRIVNTLNLVGLKKNMHQTLDRFDESKKARLKIALALYSQPEILVLDEPFIGLTKEECYKIKLIIKTIAETKKTAVFITASDMKDIEDICDTIGIIDDGFMVSIKSYNEFIKNDAPYEKVRVMTETPNYTAKIIEEELELQTYLCGEWVIVEATPSKAQTIANTLKTHGVKILSIQRVNRSLQEQYYEIISARKPRRALSGDAL